MNQEAGLKIVKDIVNEWSRVYINQVFFVAQEANILEYKVEFSKPHQTKPIPEGTVSVIFKISTAINEMDDNNGYDITFHFENESLEHSLNNTMRKQMEEVSLLSSYNFVVYSNGLTACWRTS